MSKSRRRPIRDFDGVFAVLAGSGEPSVLVGGHAVNLWSLAYYDRARAEIEPHEPLTSADLDLVATRNALAILEERLGGDVVMAGPREIALGERRDTRGSRAASGTIGRG